MATLLIVVIFGLVEARLEKPLKKRRTYLTTLLLLLAVVQNVFLNFDRLNYRVNTAVEDYLTNFLLEVSLKKPAVVFSEYDTHYFGLRYLTRVENFFSVHRGKYLNSANPIARHLMGEEVSKDIYISTLSSLFEKRNLDFMKAAVPAIQPFENENALIQANLERVQFFVAEPRQIGRFKPVYGRASMQLVDSQTASAIAAPPVLEETAVLDRMSRKFVENERNYHMTLASYALYCQWYYHRAQEELRIGATGVAESLLKQGISKVPFCWPAREQLCQIEKVTNPIGFEDCMASVRYQKEFRHNYYW